MKHFYSTAWFLWAVAALVMVSSGSFDVVAFVLFSLGALVLVHALALWSVFTNTRELSRE